MLLILMRIKKSMKASLQRALILESGKNFKAGVTAKLNKLKENTLGMNNMIENLSKETN